MKIVEGKFYRDGRGQKVGPMIAVVGLKRTIFKVSDRDGLWTDAGLPMGELLDSYTEESLRLVAEWSEIEWGDWEDYDKFDSDRLNGNFQIQRIDGRKQYRFPKPKVERVLGEVVIRGFHRSVEVTFVDGLPQWSTLKVAS